MPSSVFRATLPVNPSQTITSVSPSSSVRPSVLPANRSELAASSACASSVSWLPFSGSSPIESRETLGRSIPRISWAKIEPMYPNWRRCSGFASAVRARVDQDAGAVIRRDHDRDARAKHAGQPSDVEQAGGEHRARVPGRDDGVGITVADRANGPDERGVRLVAHGVGGLVVHLDHPVRDDVVETVRLEARPGRR